MHNMFTTVGKEQISKCSMALQVCLSELAALPSVLSAIHEERWPIVSLILSKGGWIPCMRPMVCEHLVPFAQC